MYEITSELERLTVTGLPTHLLDRRGLKFLATRLGSETPEERNCKRSRKFSRKGWYGEVDEVSKPGGAKVILHFDLAHCGPGVLVILSQYSDGAGQFFGRDNLRGGGCM